MRLKQFLKKILGQKGLGKLRYRILSPGELIRTQYHNSPGWFFDDAIMDKGKNPPGVYFIGGGDDCVEVAYELGIIDREKIEEFIKSFGLKIQLIKSSD